MSSPNKTKHNLHPESKQEMDDLTEMSPSILPDQFPDITFYHRIIPNQR